MQDQNITRLILVRHAPVSTQGRQCGRSDVEADCRTVPSQHTISQGWGTVEHVVTSPARRCVATVEALWPDPDSRPAISLEPRLWEQDFGDWEGMLRRDLPDLGHLVGEELARYRPPNGESFEQVCRRTQEALGDWVEARRGQTICMCVHAGPIRAAVALALDLTPGCALRLRVDCLSLTVLRLFGSRQWGVDRLNTPMAMSS